MKKLKIPGFKETLNNILDIYMIMKESFLSDYNRAISPVISVLILVIIAIGAATVFYSWFSGIQNAVQGSGGKLSGQAMLELSGVLKIEDVYVNTSGNSTIYIRNLGNIELSNFTVYGNGELYRTADITLKKGKLGEINTSKISVEGKTYTIKVIASQGAEAVKSIVAEG